MNQPQLRYTILGSGAVGGLYGGRLAHAGFPVSFLARSDAGALRQAGLQVETPTGAFHVARPIVATNPLELAPADVAVVTWKTVGNSQLAEILPRVLKPNGLALVLQNGLDVEADAAAILGDERVLGGCCFLCCNRTAPGKIVHLDFGRIAMATYSVPGTRASHRQRAILDQITSDFVAAGIDATMHDDLRWVRWRKLMWNIPFNGLSVALNASTDEIMKDAASEALATTLCEEVRQAAGACGVQLDPSLVPQLMDETRRMVPYDSSMRLDYLHGRPMEVETILGRPVRAAQQAGFAAPRIEHLYLTMAYLDRHRRSTQPSSASD
jgi:2-dehydropantoate 2-reductase